jgi:hypothetical protein
MRRLHWASCGAGLALVAGVLLLAGIPRATAVSVVVLLACPVMMLFMRGHRHGRTARVTANHDHRDSRGTSIGQEEAADDHRDSRRTPTPTAQEWVEPPHPDPLHRSLR